MYNTKMNIIFKNFTNGKTYDPHRLLRYITEKKCDKYVALSNLSMYYTRKKIKSNIRTINFRYQLQHGMKNLISLMDLILYQIFKIILNIS